MKQQLSEDYIGFKPWYMHGDELPWTHDTSPDGHETYVGTITTAAAATDFDADTCSYVAADALAAAKKIQFTIPQGWVGIGFRFRFNGITNDQHVLEMFAGFGPNDGHYMHFGTLTIDQGVQEYLTGAAPTGIKFCDVVTPTVENWFTLGYEGAQEGYIGCYAINTHGCDRFWIVASTLDTANAGTTLYVDFKQL